MKTTQLELEIIRNIKVWDFEKMNEQDKTPTLCELAVKTNPYSIKYIKDQTPALCALAVKWDAYSIRYIKNQTPALCRLAVSLDQEVIHGIQNREIKNQITKSTK